MDNYTNKKDDKQTVSEPEYFEIRSSIRENIRFMNQVGEKEAALVVLSLQHTPTQINYHVISRSLITRKKMYRSLDLINNIRNKWVFHVVKKRFYILTQLPD